MKFALMQPYFFPYLGYFSVMSSVDHFMFLNLVQFVKKSWITRNSWLNLSMGSPFKYIPKCSKLYNHMRKVDIHRDDVEIKTFGPIIVKNLVKIPRLAYR